MTYPQQHRIGVRQTLRQISRYSIARIPLELQSLATFVIIMGATISYLTIPNGEALDIFRHNAYIFGATLVIAIAIEFSAGAKAIIRPDIVALFTLYFLTFAEFLNPNVTVLHTTNSESAISATGLVFLGFAGLAIGRHFPFLGQRLGHVQFPEVSAAVIFRILLVMTFIGYLYVLVSVNFNVLEIFSSLLRQRFAQPWGRGRLGDWSSLLHELNLMLYVVVAIAGYIIANPRLFSFPKRIVVWLILAFMFFFDFAGGTRNILLIKAGLFLLAYFMSGRKMPSAKIFVLSVLALAILWSASKYMLEMRTVGLGTYLEMSDSSDSDESDKTMIDNNMYSIARIMQVFPDFYEYPGIDVIWTSLVHPIPRALWPSKPVDWGTSIEEALGAQGYTVAVTYVGEAYLTAGYFGTILISLFFGSFSSAWTRVGLSVRTNTGMLFYVSGFYAVTLGMRSMQWITVAILPTIAFYVLSRWFPTHRSKK